MLAPTPCATKCTFHSKRDTHLPCRACASKHVSSARAAADRSNAPKATSVGIQPQLGERDNRSAR